MFQPSAITQVLYFFSACSIIRYLQILLSAGFEHELALLFLQNNKQLWAIKSLKLFSTEGICMLTHSYYIYHLSPNHCNCRISNKAMEITCIAMGVEYIYICSILPFQNLCQITLFVHVWTLMVTFYSRKQQFMVVFPVEGFYGSTIWSIT